MPHAFGEPSSAETRAALASTYATCYEALAERDADRAVACLDPGFTAILADGTSTDRAGYAALLRVRLAGARRFGPAHVAIEELVEGADHATATVVRTVLLVPLDPVDPHSTVETFEEARSRDTWGRRDGRWLLQRSASLGEPVEATVRRDVADGPRVARLRAEVAAGDPTAVERFWAGIAGQAPLIEPMESDPRLARVTFLWRSARPDPVSVGGGLMWVEIDKPLARLGDTDVWYRTELLPMTGRFNYWFSFEERRPEPREVVIQRQVPDPLNSRPTEGVSWFELPGAPAQPYLEERPGVSRGEMTQAILPSVALGEERTYSVHLPAGYRPEGEANRLLVLFDGEIYGGGPEPCVPAPRIVDNLVADGRIPPVVVLLVHNLPGMRARDLTCSAAFLEYVATELVPVIQDTYRAGRRPEHVVAAGSSYGGLAAAFCGLRHPDVFGNVLSMSGAFSYTHDWPPASSYPFGGGEGLLMREFSASPTLPLRFWLDVGRFELPIQLFTNRHLRNVLELKGYPVTYSQFDGGHTYSAWRGSLANGLIDLLGDATADAPKPTGAGR